jgi:hypothetical protein
VGAVVAQHRWNDTLAHPRAVLIREKPGNPYVTASGPGLAQHALGDLQECRHRVSQRRGCGPHCDYAAYVDSESDLLAAAQKTACCQAVPDLRRDAVSRVCVPDSPQREKLLPTPPGHRCSVVNACRKTPRQVREQMGCGTAAISWAQLPELVHRDQEQGQTAHSARVTGSDWGWLFHGAFPSG